MQEAFKRELDFALSDPNLCILVYAATILEEEGENGRLPGITAQAPPREPQPPAAGRSCCHYAPDRDLHPPHTRMPVVRAKQVPLPYCPASS
ncbi:MAG TPA: hypothetical protein ENF23_07650 [Methanosarcinales archaeon]|nr:hypothetical protein [Methanosarcinales archaeon]